MYIVIKYKDQKEYPRDVNELLAKFSSITVSNKENQ